MSAWKFRKFHNVKRVQLRIIVLGWVEICSGQSAARGHRELLTPCTHAASKCSVFWGEGGVGWTKVTINIFFGIFIDIQKHRYLFFILLSLTFK